MMQGTDMRGDTYPERALDTTLSQTAKGRQWEATGPGFLGSHLRMVQKDEDCKWNEEGKGR